ncbi:hypothetical protein GGS21DRAFT_546049 [Xylaria nigripes]|nr:hypothetical protein GGS21DRAFT_546049 [Xylaria nigripes]
MKMKILLSLAAIPITTADFWMVYQRRYAQFGRAEVTSYGTSFVHDVPAWTCEKDAFGHHVFQDRRNVSDHFGVNFDPWNAQPGPLWHDPLVTVNINLTSFEFGRQTISRFTDDVFTMVNENNVTTGQCYENRTFVVDLDCWWRHPDSRVVQYHVNINGSSMFFYESDIEVKQVGDGWVVFQQDAQAAGFLID